MDEMKEVVTCNCCGKPEFYGEMRWLSGKCMCRNCYKKAYEREYKKLYTWTDLNGPRPTFAEILKQKMRAC